MSILVMRTTLVPMTRLRTFAGRGLQLASCRPLTKLGSSPRGGEGRDCKGANRRRTTIEQWWKWNLNKPFKYFVKSHWDCKMSRVLTETCFPTCSESSCFHRDASCIAWHPCIFPWSRHGAENPEGNTVTVAIDDNLTCCLHTMLRTWHTVKVGFCSDKDVFYR